MTVERDVLINVSAVPEKENLDRFKGIADEIRKLQKQAENSAVALAKNKIATAAQQATQAVEKETAALVRSRKAANETAQAQAELARQQEIVRTANEQVAESAGRTITGVMGMARGFAALGIAGEENLEKVARALIKAQGFFDVTRGIMDAAVGIQKWARAYSMLKTASVAANTAAARSHDLLAASQHRQAEAASAAATANGAAATTAGGLAAANTAAAGAGAAAGAAGAGGAIVGGLGAAVTALAGLAAAAVAIVAVGASVVAFFDKDFREGLLEWIGWTHKAADATKDYEQAMRDRAAKDKSQADWLAKEAEKRKVERDYAAAGTPATAAELMAQLKKDQTAASDSLDNDGSLSAYAVRREANENELATLKRIKEYHSNQVKQARELNLEKIRGAQKTLSLIKEQYDREKERLTLVKAQREGSAVAFGEMSATEQGRVLAAKRKLDTKGASAMRKDEWDDLSKLGLNDVEEKRRAHYRSVAMSDPGYVALVDRDLQRREAATSASVQNLKGQIDAGIKVGGTVTVKLDSDVGAIADEIMKTVEPQLKAALPDFEAMIKDVTLRMIDEKYLEAEFQKAAARRGASR